MNELSIRPSAIKVVPTGIHRESLECQQSAQVQVGPREAQRPRTPRLLSLAQQQVWTYASLAHRIPLCNTAFIVRYAGPINQNALEQTLSNWSDDTRAYEPPLRPTMEFPSR